MNKCAINKILADHKVLWKKKTHGLLLNRKQDLVSKVQYMSAMYIEKQEPAKKESIGDH